MKHLYTHIYIYIYACACMGHLFRSPRKAGYISCTRSRCPLEPADLKPWPDALNLGRALGHFIFSLIGLKFKRILFTNILQKL